jgi:hypothetical protein
MTTRKSLVTKKWSFPYKSDDEKWSRRQKVEFFAQKWRRERVSSPKNGLSRIKMTTRSGLVTKKWSFPYKNEYEKVFRRQKVAFPG